MADCVNLSACPFFHDRMAKKSVLAYVYKQRFCKGDSAECARFVTLHHLGKGNVPADLYPNEMAKARQIILTESAKGNSMSVVCECFEKCELFSSSVAKLPSTAKSFQDKFCSIDPHSCARYIVFKQLGQSQVPSDLFPNERGRALKLIEAA